MMDYYEEVLLLRKKLAKFEKLDRLIKHGNPDNSGYFFICGEAGKKDSMGLPEKILVCPAYGLDGFATYKKDKDYSGPGW
jgi:hypothetical protein